MTERTGDVLPFLGKAQPDEPEAVSDVAETLEETVLRLLSTVEEMDRGIKLMIGVIAEQDKRLRGLELAQRKSERRNVTAIVNQHGEKVN